MSITVRYLHEYNKYKKQYGEKTLVLMQVGSFYELYATDTDGPKLKDIADSNKIEFDKRTITALARPLIENGVNASKNSAIKNAASLGAVFAAGSFLTAEDEKISAAGEGFILGASVYGAAKIVNKFLKTSRDNIIKVRQADFEDTINAIEINSHK